MEAVVILELRSRRGNGRINCLPFYTFSSVPSYALFNLGAATSVIHRYDTGSFEVRKG